MISILIVVCTLDGINKARMGNDGCSSDAPRSVSYMAKKLCNINC